MDVGGGDGPEHGVVGISDSVCYYSCRCSVEGDRRSLCQTAGDGGDRGLEGPFAKIKTKGQKKEEHQEQ